MDKVKFHRMLMSPISAAVQQAHKINHHRPARVPSQRYPARAVLQYEQDIKGLVAELKRSVINNLFPKLKYLETQVLHDHTDGVRQDQWPVDIANAVEALKLKFLKDHASQITGIAAITARATALVNEQTWIQISRAVLGVDLLGSTSWEPAKLEAFAVQNSGLITNLTAETYDKVGNTVLTGFRAGKTSDAIEKELLSTGVALPVGPFKSAATRAELIARDQVGKLNGEITPPRMTDLGIEKYTWETSHDDRVRPEDEEKDGMIFEWANPPLGGPPGYKINCRCSAIPLIPEYDEVLGTEEVT